MIKPKVVNVSKHRFVDVVVLDQNLTQADLMVALIEASAMVLSQPTSVERKPQGYVIRNVSLGDVD